MPLVFHKTLSVGAELLRADGRTDEQKDRDSRRTDMRKLIVAYSQLYERDLKYAMWRQEQLKPLK